MALTHEQFLAACAWAWARGCVDMLTSLLDHGYIGRIHTRRFAQSWADAIDEAMQEHGIPDTDRIDVLHQFDDLLRS